MEKEITISNNLNEITVLANFIEEVGEELSLSCLLYTSRCV